MKYSFLDPQNTIKVSKICLGTMTWGYQNSEQEAHEQIDYALSKGINFIDTAEVYAVPPSKETYGKTETFIGNWFAKNKDKRKDIILASKMVGKGQNYIRDGKGVIAKDISTAIDGSLKRLKTDYLDLYQLHWPTRNVNYFGQFNYDPNVYSIEITNKEINDIEETLQVLSQEIKKGRIRNIGLSNETAWGVMQYKLLSKSNKNLASIITIQNVYSLISRLFDYNNSEMCMKEQVGLLAYSPLAGGLLSGKYRNGNLPQGSRFSTWGFLRQDRYKTKLTLEAATKYSELAESFNLTPSLFALAFVNNRPFVTSNIIGATTMEQLKENIESININLTNEMLLGIENIFNDFRSPAP